jgi:AFG3 family protein
MSTNNQKDKKNIIKDSNFKPKFNFYWIYGALFVLFVVFQFFNSESLMQKEISQNKFESILTSGDVSKIVIVNRSVANLYKRRSNV